MAAAHVPAEVVARAFQKTAERLPTLYHLSSEYDRLLSLLEDPEADPSEVESELVRFATDITTKAHGVAVVIRQLEGLAELQKLEAQRLAARSKANASHAEKMREYVLACMQEIGSQRIETGGFVLSIRKNPEAVTVVDAAAVPNEYQRTKITIEPDKIAIRDWYKATGEIVTGVEITRSERLDIR